MPKIPQAKLRVVAEFAPHSFLENMAVRADGSMLVTVQNHKELWHVPAPAPSGLVQPTLLHSFEFNTTFVVEWKPERFLLGVADVYATQEARLYAIDLRDWHPGEAIRPKLVLQMPQPWAGFNGAAFIAPDVMIAAGMARLLWRIDLRADDTATARIWLEHDSMKNRPGEMKPEQPGTNGVQYSARTGHLYYTTTSQQLMMRVKLDPAGLEPADLPEFVAGGREWDDFLIDDENGVAYATTHRENTIDRVRLAHDGNRDGRSIVAGDPFDARLVGPSAGGWSRAPGEHGRIAYVATDGGTAQPPADGITRTAKILRVELPPVQAG
jgi:hypothetical protein